jgi:hypothetical protein
MHVLCTVFNLVISARESLLRSTAIYPNPAPRQVKTRRNGNLYSIAHSSNNSVGLAADSFLAWGFREEGALIMENDFEK